MKNGIGCAVLAFTAWLPLSSAVGSETVAEKPATVEQGVYAEQTLGDLDKAIAAYKTVIQTQKSRRAEAAKAHLGLARCYIKKGQQEQATQVLETLFKDFPQQEACLKEGRALLAKVNPKSGALRFAPIGKLLPAPWKSGETVVYKQEGMPITMTTTTTQTMHNGSPCWKTVLQLSTAQGTATMQTLMDYDSLLPIQRIDQAKGHKVTTDFTSQRAAISYYKEERKTFSRSFPTPKGTYGHEQLFSLLRRLPLEAGVPITIPTFMRGAIRYEEAILQEKQETVTVPAGTFTCQVIDVASGPVPKKIWRSIQERILVQMGNKGKLMQLQEIRYAAEEKK